METEGSIPVKAKTFAWLCTSTSRHGRIRQVYDLIHVVYIGDGVAACVCGQGEFLIIASNKLLESRVAAARARAKGVLDWQCATASLARL